MDRLKQFFQKGIVVFIQLVVNTDIKQLKKEAW
jgi:hypothetical protein